MKLDKPLNDNYCASVVKLKSLVTLPNCDNVVGTPIFGFQAIVSKDVKVGDIGLVFPAETQLTDEYCYENCLFRHDDKNKKLGVKGYIEDNRRIKAVKFRNQRSDCLFMPLESLAYLGVKPTDFQEGDEFDTLKGHEICRKYVVKVRETRVNKQAIPKVFKRVDAKYFPEHLDSDNYFKFKDEIAPDTQIIVTQKIHGTSIRISNTIVKRKLRLHEHLAKRLGIRVMETELDYVYGSRRSVKDINNPHAKHFYKSDIWTIEGEKLKGILPENFMLFGELIGWTPGNAPIQKHYTYKIEPGLCELYIYRVAFINSQGIMTDLSWDQLVEFCTPLGLKPVPELWRGKHSEFDVTQFIDQRFRNTYPHALPLEDDPSLVDEGVCIRVDRLVPYITKAKGPIFYAHESKMLDEEVVDLETEGSTDETVTG